MRIKLPDFLTRMDKDARRAILVVCAMFAVVLLILMFGRASMTTDETTFQRWFEAFSQSPWAIPIVIATFVGAAFLGVPQWALIAGTMVAFGPLWGGVYAWISTLLSASVNFWLGRWIGAERVRRYGGDLVNRIIGIVRRNGFIASFAVRLVPTGPFVLVNMAAGVSGMGFVFFLLGTALGIIPKILVVGLFAQGLLSGAQGKNLTLVFILLAVIFVGIMLLARKRLGHLVSDRDETAKKSN